MQSCTVKIEARTVRTTSLARVSERSWNVTFVGLAKNSGTGLGDLFRRFSTIFTSPLFLVERLVSAFISRTEMEI
jgi:hypothetical protein